MLAGWNLFAGPQWVPRYASPHVLGTKGSRHQTSKIGGSTGKRNLPYDIVFDEWQYFPHIFIFIVMRVHIDYQHVIEIAAASLFSGMRKQMRSIELLDCYAPATIRYEFHRFCLSKPLHLHQVNFR